jgi:hypothetical protein
VNRFFADHPQHRTGSAVHQHPLTRHQVGIDAADRREVEKAVIVDIAHHETDFIAMPGQHDPQPALGPAQAGDHVAHHVGAQFVGHPFQFAADNALHRLLETGGARGFHQFLQ